MRGFVKACRLVPLLDACVGRSLGGRVVTSSKAVVCSAHAAYGVVVLHVVRVVWSIVDLGRRGSHVFTAVSTTSKGTVVHSGWPTSWRATCSAASSLGTSTMLLQCVWLLVGVRELETPDIVLVETVPLERVNHKRRLKVILEVCKAENDLLVWVDFPRDQPDGLKSLKRPKNV